MPMDPKLLGDQLVVLLQQHSVKYLNENKLSILKLGDQIVNDLLKAEVVLKVIPVLKALGSTAEELVEIEEICLGRDRVAAITGKAQSESSETLQSVQDSAKKYAATFASMLFGMAYTAGKAAIK